MHSQGRFPSPFNIPSLLCKLVVSGCAHLTQKKVAKSIYKCNKCIFKSSFEK